MSNQKLTEEKLEELIDNAKEFFRNEIALSHEKKSKELGSLKKFTLNPFLDKYKATFLTGNDDPESIAKALVYPRVLGTSINTIFGNQLQKFTSDVLEGFASTTSGIDIEFVDKIDNRKKYCQIKAGPNTINKDDIETIKNHFKGVRNLARTNNLSVNLNDLVVGVMYGEPRELSNHYKVINEEYPVIIGHDFWHRITGEENFYQRITDAIADIALEFDGSAIVEESINQLAAEIESTLDLEGKDES